MYIEGDHLHIAFVLLYARKYADAMDRNQSYHGLLKFSKNAGTYDPTTILSRAAALLIRAAKVLYFVI